MEAISATTIGAIDLINLSKDIAQLNLGYLGISVAILGVFIYFNFKPLKESLDKQEKTISDLKEEADKLLGKAKTQSDNALEDFKKKQLEETSKLLKEQFKKTVLEIESRSSKLEKTLLEEIEDTSENKDIKLKEFILLKTTNKISVAEKSINADINKLKTDFSEEKSSTDAKISSLEEKAFDFGRSLVNFEIEHYLKKGQVGAMRKMIEKLEMDIKRGWGEEGTILEIRDYIVERGMPNYYINNLTKVIEKMPKNLDVVSKEVIALAQKELYDPKTINQSNSPKK